MKPALRQTGVTPEGLRVVRSVFPLVDTHGIPLDLVLDQLRERQMMPDWFDYFDAAVAAGAKPERVLVRLAAAIGDVFGPAFRDPWEVTFRAILIARDKLKAETQPMLG